MFTCLESNESIVVACGSDAARADTKQIDTSSLNGARLTEIPASRREGSRQPLVQIN